MGSVQKMGAERQLQKRGLGKSIAVPRSHFWLLCLLIWGVPLLLSSFQAAEQSYMELCLNLPSFLLWLGLFHTFPYLPISNKYFSFSFAVSVVSDNFPSFIYFPTQNSLSHLLLSGVLQTWWAPLSDLLFSAQLLVQHSLLEPLNLWKDRANQGGYCTLTKSLSIIQSSGS